MKLKIMKKIKKHTEVNSAVQPADDDREVKKRICDILRLNTYDAQNI